MRQLSGVLAKSFGNGIMLLQYGREASLEEARTFGDALGATEVIPGPDGLFYALMSEPRPVIAAEVRMTEEDWEGMASSVASGGSEAFRSRLRDLELGRSAILASASG